MAVACDSYYYFYCGGVIVVVGVRACKGLLTERCGGEGTVSGDGTKVRQKKFVLLFFQHV